MNTNVQSTYTVKLEVPFSSKRLAEIAYHVLRVDKEPKRSGVTKKLSFNENLLQLEFNGGIKQVRVAVNGFFDKLYLMNQTIEFAGPPKSDSYSFFS